MARTYTLKRNTPANPVGRRIDYKAELNEQQCDAVTAGPGPMLVIAGAGSGKTRTLTYRVAYLLENGVEPSNILLLTFTNKAAREMQERVSTLLPDSAAGLWGGTFHSIGNKILRRHAEAIGFRRGFSIMDREDQEDLMKTVIAAAGIDPKEKRFPKPEVVAGIFSMAVNTGRDVGKIVDENTRISSIRSINSARSTPATRPGSARRTRWISTTCSRRPSGCCTTTTTWPTATSVSSSTSWSMNTRTPITSRPSSSISSPRSTAI